MNDPHSAQPASVADPAKRAEFAAALRQAIVELPSTAQNGGKQSEVANPIYRVPIHRVLLSDSLTPVLAYRRLVRGDARLAPSFLFESVIDGDRVGRYSFMGARPAAEIVVRGQELTYCDHVAGTCEQSTHANPLAEIQRLTDDLPLVIPHAAQRDGLPTFTGGWVGLVGYDTVRYAEPDKLNAPPADDRGLPDIHLLLARDLIIFDHARKTILVVTHADFDADAIDALGRDTHGNDAAEGSAYAAAQQRLDQLTSALAHRPDSLGQSEDELVTAPIDLSAPPPTLPDSNMGAPDGPGGYEQAVKTCKQYIAAGDAFQIVPSQRFEITSHADPYDVYRTLRVVNPSPYMFYLQIEGCVLVGSSPEILCRVQDGEATTRPLAGTRHRGATEQLDAQLAEDLQADPKDRAEHSMLVDLHRNDLGRVCKPGTIELTSLMDVERYSHVMHLSSTVTGQLRAGEDRWSALACSLPVGTVSGAPKIRAMQIIDELEPTRRGPYAGAVGYADFAGNMDMAIALRTLVCMPGEGTEALRHEGTEGERSDEDPSPVGGSGPAQPGRWGQGSNPDDARPQSWKYHIQAGAGIVADSDPQLEHVETLNKAAAMGKAIELAEKVLGGRQAGDRMTAD